MSQLKFMINPCSFEGYDSIFYVYWCFFLLTDAIYIWERERERVSEPYGEPRPNFIKKFEFEPNLIIAETKLKPKPCDLGWR